VSFPVIPPDTRAPGYSGHIVDHNAISDSLSAHQSALNNLQAIVPGSITLSSQQNVSYTLQLTDLGTVVEMNASGPVTLTIPPSTQAGFSVGAVLWVARMGTGTVTIVAGTGVTIWSVGVNMQISAQYAEVKLRQRILNTWVVSGSIT
jgi:hypothetical protein